MAGVLYDGGKASFSVFDLAAAKDMGFWDIDSTFKPDIMFWGKGQGCDFVINSCNSSKNYEEYGTVDGNYYCSDDHRFIGGFAIDVYSTCGYNSEPINFNSFDLICSETNSNSRNYL